MKKLGFFGGSFNPPTYAHINVAKMSIEKFNLDAVYFVPVGNLYNKLSLIDENYRYKMLELICDDKIMVENIELGRKQTLNTLQAFELIEQKYKSTENYYIMGADNFEKLPTWKNAKELIENFTSGSAICRWAFPISSWKGAGWAARWCWSFCSII